MSAQNEEHENCHVEPIEKTLDKNAITTAQAAFLSVHGMGCPRCATRVRNGLLLQEGVVFSDVILERGMAVVAYDPERVTPDHLIAAVANAGNDGRHNYQATLLQTVPASQVFHLS